MRYRSLPFALLGALLLTSLPAVSHTQETARDSAQRIATDSAHARLFTKHDAELAATFAVATVALLPFDEWIGRRMQRPRFQLHSFVNRTANDIEFLAQPGVLIGSGAAYLIGRVAHQKTLADVGLHVSEAVIVGSVTTNLLKGLSGRARPYVNGNSNSNDWGFGRGFKKGQDYDAFPSGHTTLAFAGASALTSETARWHPGATKFVAPITYGGATIIALARMYHEQHWASDVMMGAGIGTLSGLVVVRRQHAHPHNWLNRTLLSATVAPTRGGMAVMMSLPASGEMP